MAFLTIDGDTYEIAVDGASENAPEEVGNDHRAFSGNMRSSIRGIRRKWSFKTIPMVESQAQALKDKIYSGFQECSGDALDGQAVLCSIKMSESPYLQEGLGHVRQVVLDLFEVTTPPATRVLTTIELSPTPITLDD